MKTIERTRDVVTGAADLEDLHTLPRFPVFMGCVDHPPADDLAADMVWAIGRESGAIQLRQLIPLDILYQSFHNSGVVGAIWMDHHRSLSKFLARLKPRSVLEIGGAHGILAKEYHQSSKIPWTILEPNPSPIGGCEASFIKGFFDEKFTYDEEFDAVVHSHVFEHMYEPDKFVAQLAGLIPPGKHLVFSVPNLGVMLERKYTNCLNFEHTVFIAEPYVELLLSRHGFRIVDKEYFLDDHSIFFAAVRDDDVDSVTLSPELYARNRSLYLDYVEFHKKLIAELNSTIHAYAQPVYLFGAHVFAQYLIAFGLDTSRIRSLLDNDKTKQGRRLYGTNLMVESPVVLAGQAEPVVILRAGVFNEEIKAGIRHKINPGTIFLD